MHALYNLNFYRDSIVKVYPLRWCLVDQLIVSMMSIPFVT